MVASWISSLVAGRPTVLDDAMAPLTTVRNVLGLMLAEMRIKKVDHVRLLLQRDHTSGSSAEDLCI